VVLSSDKQRFGLRGPSHDAIKPEQLDSAAWPHLGRWHAHVAFLRTSHLRRSSYPAGVEPLCGTGTALQSAAVGQKGVQQHAMLSGSVAGLSRKAAKTRAMELSQSLSMLLRHQARELSIPIDPFGWVDLEHALAHVNSYEGDDALEGGFPATAEEVRQVVLSSDKQRFGLRGPSHDGAAPIEQIRANQGHTMEGIDADLTPISAADIPQAVHGTYLEAWDVIKREGISRMSRNHVHLAKDLPGESGVISGMRRSCQVLIWIDIAAAEQAGFYLPPLVQRSHIDRGADTTKLLQQGGRTQHRGRDVFSLVSAVHGTHLK